MKVSWSPPVPLIKPSRTKCDRGSGGGLEPSDSKLLPTLYGNSLRAKEWNNVVYPSLLSLSLSVSFPYSIWNSQKASNKCPRYTERSNSLFELSLCLFLSVFLSFSLSLFHLLLYISTNMKEYYRFMLQYFDKLIIKISIWFYSKTL